MKSKLSLEEFKALWYYNMEIDPDQISDEKLRDMYVSLLASGQDYEETAIAIEEYIGERSVIHAAGDAYVEQQSNGSGPELSN